MRAKLLKCALRQRGPSPKHNSAKLIKSPRRGLFIWESLGAPDCDRDVVPAALGVGPRNELLAGMQSSAWVGRVG